MKGINTYQAFRTASKTVKTPENTAFSGVLEVAYPAGWRRFAPRLRRTPLLSQVCPHIPPGTPKKYPPFGGYFLAYPAGFEPTVFRVGV